jgi:hypothetical protein
MPWDTAGHGSGACSAFGQVNRQICAVGVLPSGEDVAVTWGPIDETQLAELAVIAACDLDVRIKT